MSKRSDKNDGNGWFTTNKMLLMSAGVLTGCTVGYLLFQHRLKNINNTNINVNTKPRFQNQSISFKSSFFISHEMNSNITFIKDDQVSLIQDMVNVSNLNCNINSKCSVYQNKNNILQLNSTNDDGEMSTYNYYIENDWIELKQDFIDTFGK